MSPFEVLRNEALGVIDDLVRLVTLFKLTFKRTAFVETWLYHGIMQKIRSYYVLVPM